MASNTLATRECRWCGEEQPDHCFETWLCQAWQLGPDGCHSCLFHATYLTVPAAVDKSGKRTRDDGDGDEDEKEDWEQIAPEAKRRRVSEEGDWVETAAAPWSFRGLSEAMRFEDDEVWDETMMEVEADTEVDVEAEIEIKPNDDPYDGTCDHAVSPRTVLEPEDEPCCATCDRAFIPETQNEPETETEPEDDELYPMSFDLDVFSFVDDGREGAGQEEEGWNHFLWDLFLGKVNRAVEDQVITEFCGIPAEEQRGSTRLDSLLWDALDY